MNPKDTKLSEAQMFDIATGAFAPYVCTPEFPDYENKFCFSVVDRATKQHFKSEVLNVAVASNASRLKATIDSVRKQMEEAGLSLDHWIFPEV